MTTDTKSPTLRELFAAPVEITVGQHKLAVRPMGWYQASEAIEVVLPVFNDLPLFDQSGDENEAVGKWLAMAIAHRDRMLQFCALATGFAEDELVHLAPAQIADLVMGVVELNADFFVQALPTLAARARARLEALAEKFNASQGPTTSSSA